MLIIISWVDRDMFMRYCGGGPGHIGLPSCDIAWGFEALSKPSENINAEQTEVDQLNVIATKVGEHNDAELVQNAQVDEALLAEQCAVLEETLDDLI